LVPGSVKTPGSLWSASQPNSTSLNFANALVAANGKGLTQAFPRPIGAGVTFTGSGDGYNPVITASGKLMGVNHHTNPTPIWCFDMNTGAACTGYKKFLDPEGYPAVAPPWGTLNAINLNTGHYAWTIPFGEYPELAAKGMKDTGTENYGGPAVTAGGLVFIGATNDKRFRAFDAKTGKELWVVELPASGHSTPVTYMGKDGKQYVVIAASGGTSVGSGRPISDALVAFRLE